MVHILTINGQWYILAHQWYILAHQWYTMAHQWYIMAHQWYIMAHQWYILCQHCHSDCVYCFRCVAEEVGREVVSRLLYHCHSLLQHMGPLPLPPASTAKVPQPTDDGNLHLFLNTDLTCVIEAVCFSVVTLVSKRLCF